MRDEHIVALQQHLLGEDMHTWEVDGTYDIDQGVIHDIHTMTYGMAWLR